MYLSNHIPIWEKISIFVNSKLLIRIILDKI